VAPHPRIPIADIGVDFGEQLYLRFEAGRIERIFVAIEPHIGMRGCCGKIPAIAAADGCDRVCRPDQRRQRNVGRMRVADRVVLHRAQAKALRGVIGGLLQPPIVEHQRLGLGIFQEQLAVIGALEPAGDLVAYRIAVKIGAVEQRGCGGHEGSKFFLSSPRSRDL
jgi:hypothetical protein